MKKFGIDCGHTLVGGDTGAEGIFKEQEKTREIGNLVISKLQSLGFEVVNCTIDNATLNDSLAHRYNTANDNNVDEYVSIHLNCGGGHGVETLINNRGTHAEEMADSVQKAMVNLGYADRGVKVAIEYLGYNLAVLKHTNMPAILVECGFVDSQEDCNRYNANNIANAIVYGLTNEQAGDVTPVVTPSPSVSPSPSTDNDTLRIQKILNRLQIKDANGNSLVEDGINGANTTFAIKRFQSICGLTADGIVGNITNDAFNEILNKPLCGVPYTQRIATRYIQYRLGITIDGIFLYGTEGAVKNFQSSHGLTSDGIVGNNSWGALIG